MTNRLLKLIPIVLAVLVPAVGCGKPLPTTPIVTPPGAEFVLTGLILEDNGDEGLPLPGAELILSQTPQAQEVDPQDIGSVSRTATTDEDGRFSVNVTRGSWFVAIRKEGFENRTIVLSIDGNTTMNFSLSKLLAAKAAKAVRR